MEGIAGTPAGCQHQPNLRCPACADRWLAAQIIDHGLALIGSDCPKLVNLAICGLCVRASAGPASESSAERRQQSEHSEHCDAHSASTAGFCIERSAKQNGQETCSTSWHAGSAMSMHTWAKGTRCAAACQRCYCQADAAQCAPGHALDHFDIYRADLQVHPE